MGRNKGRKVESQVGYNDNSQGEKIANGKGQAERRKDMQNRRLPTRTNKPMTAIGNSNGCPEEEKGTNPEPLQRKKRKHIKRKKGEHDPEEN